MRFTGILMLLVLLGVGSWKGVDVVHAESQSGAPWESENGTPAESECGGQTETESETQTESESETQTELESETQIESESGTQTETESESSTETETETQKKVIKIRGIKTAYRNNTRTYDGTKSVKLVVEVENLPAGLLVEAEGIAEFSRVGTWKVKITCELKGKNADEYNLKIPNAPIKVNIVPKVLDIEIADAKKEYYTDNNMGNLIFEKDLDKRLQVTGFVKDGKATKDMPKGFEMPQLAIDPNVIQKSSPMFDAGIPIKYENAIVLKKDSQGDLTGNTTENYYYDLRRNSAHYKPGCIELTKRAIIEGQDFRAAGNAPENYLRTEDGMIWIKKYGGFSIFPNTDSGFSYIEKIEDLQGAGTCQFTLKSYDEAGNLTAESLPSSLSYSIDHSAPRAAKIYGNSVDITGNDGDGDANVYYAKDIQVHMQGYYDEQTGIRSVQYRVVELGKGESIDEVYLEDHYDMQSTMWREGTSLTLAEEGYYQIFVRLEDRVGNTAYVRSKPVTIDKQKPEIAIRGVKDKSANNKQLHISVKGEDLNYKQGSLKAQLIGMRSGKKIPYQVNDKIGGELLTFQDIPSNKQSDDLYVLTVQLEDWAGNKFSRKMEFSINRFGSVYQLSSELVKRVKQFYFMKPFDIIINEYNVDFLEQAQVFVSHDGKLRELKKSKDYQVERKGTDRTWKTYQYKIHADNFYEEGIYAVTLVTKDRSGNNSDNKIQNKYIEFAIDRTSPSLIVTGLEHNRFYQEKSREITIEARDYICLEEVSIYLDDVLVKTSRESVVNYKIKEQKKWQSLKVCASDKAGNITWMDEMEFCVTMAKEGEIVKPNLQTKKDSKLESDKESDIRNFEEKEKNAAAERDVQKEGNQEADTKVKLETGKAQNEDKGNRSNWVLAAVCGGIILLGVGVGGIIICRRG